MPSYDFRAASEFVWFVLTAAGIAIAQILTSTDPATVTDYRTYGLAILGAAIRAGSGAVLDWAKNHQPPPRLTQEEFDAMVAKAVAAELAKRSAPQLVVPPVAA